jgi:hypothetical protein
MAQRMPKVHIYRLSRLVHAPAARWEHLLFSIEEGKTHAYRYYLPMREAVVRFCEGGGQRRDSIVSQIVEAAHRVGGTRGPSLAPRR